MTTPSQERIFLQGTAANKPATTRQAGARTEKLGGTQMHQPRKSMTLEQRQDVRFPKTNLGEGLGKLCW